MRGCCQMYTSFCDRHPQLDVWFSYQTGKVVSIKDRRLGFLYLLINLAVLTYVGVYVFAIKRSYYASQFSVGNVAVKIKGRTSAEGRIPYDEADLIIPPIETDGAFVATGLLRTPDQKRDYCPPATKMGSIESIRCTKNEECTGFLDGTAFIYVPGQCRPVFIEHTGQTENICVYLQWCPPETEETYDPITNKSNSEKFHFDDQSVYNMTIWFKGNVRFNQLTNTIAAKDRILFSTLRDKTPHLFNRSTGDTAGANMYSVRDLLTDLLPAEQRGNCALTKGSLINVVLNWECYVYSGNSYTTYKVDRLDLLQTPPPPTGCEGESGFNFRTARYFYPNNVTNYSDPLSGHRELTKYYGIRFFFESSGLGYGIDLVAILVNIGSGVALLGVSTVVVDMLATKLLAEKQIYKRYKVQETDLMCHFNEEDRKMLVEELDSSRIDIDEIKRKKKEKTNSPRNPVETTPILG